MPSAQQAREPAGGELEPLFSTKDVHPRDRFARWHEIISAAILPHDCDPEDRTRFEAELQSARIADLTLVSFQNSAMHIKSTHEHASRSDELVVIRQIEGSQTLEQEGRQAVLAPGDIALVDLRLPHSSRFAAGSRNLSVKFPRRQLEARIGNVRRLAAVPLKPSASEGAFVSAFLGMLPNHAGTLDHASAQLVSNQALDLIAVSLGKLWQERPRVSSGRSVTLLNLRTVIEARLADPGLDPEAVAAAAGVSVRYANLVLENEGTSLARLIQERRLERCRIALADPGLAHRNISEIAYGWAFTDLSHFGRKFRAAYGVSPRDYRREQLGAAGPEIIRGTAL